MDQYIATLKRYADFSGRSRRKEYWMFVLINFIIAIVLAVIESIIGTQGIIGMLFSLLILVPGIAVTVRRLHDTGRSGWWILIALVPLVGGIVLLVFCAMDSEPGDNEYGPNPKLLDGPTEV